MNNYNDSPVIVFRRYFLAQGVFSLIKNKESGKTSGGEDV